ncbi:putative 3-(3-hydroxy-phenyl)propionate hydroxylase [Phaeomoniella chlamydospora]|uniref:Putative 3-(3-hydroxy-phenyl)propionate hydroxylase n=1 Tax=Phaeomoniella chlamydospora TaxID=158046 RepID=A0A0G2E2F0_PHACM|nr:putative 3-(3-hydroxy-phenyl)propionate hydroxylase [Phaeomoniella chlamydospora]
MGESATDKHLEDVRVPVLIIGGGPTGLFQAYLLACLGVKCLVVERYPQRLGAPKAHAVNPRTLEICRQFGLKVHEIRAIGTPRKDAFWVNFITTLSGEAVGRLPYERMDVGVLDDTPEMIHNIPQPEFERYVEDTLSSEPNVRIEKGVSFVSLKNGDKEVITTVEYRPTGQHFNITSSHVIACDGANSKVREFLQVESDGEPSVQTMMTIHFNADLRPVVGERVGMLHWVMDPEGAGFIIGYDLAGNQVHISNYSTEKTPTESWNEEMCRNILCSAIGKECPFDIHSFRPWIFRRKIANKYRVGNVLLAGDAAHSFPPTGGLGLNCGLADVHNLAFKVAAVHRGWATDSILDTYQPERRHVADIYSRQSVKNGYQIFNLLKSVGLAGEASLSAARENLYRNNRDPAKKTDINTGIEGQREHFDNLENHIGYTYSDPPVVPANASLYIPKYTAGARLPHTWIAFPESSSIPFPPHAVDLSYIDDHEMSASDKAQRKYTSLDLCARDEFTFILGKKELSRHILKVINDVKEVYSARGLKFRVVHLEDDFNIIEGQAGRNWITGTGIGDGQGGLLVRPDQHIILKLRGNETAKDEVIAGLKKLLGCQTND